MGLNISNLENLFSGNDSMVSGGIRKNNNNNNNNKSSKIDLKLKIDAARIQCIGKNQIPLDLNRKNDSNYLIKNGVKTADLNKMFESDGYSTFIKKTLNKEIEYLKLNELPENEIDNFINEGSIVSHCKEQLNKSSYYPIIEKQFVKNSEGRVLIVDHEKVELKKRMLRELILSILNALGTNESVSEWIVFKDLSGIEKNFIAFRKSIEELNVVLWSGKTYEKSTSENSALEEVSSENSPLSPWTIHSGDRFLIQKIYNITEQKFLVLKHVSGTISERLCNWAINKVLGTEECINSFATSTIKKSICPIYSTISIDRDTHISSLYGVVMPHFAGDLIELSDSLLDTNKKMLLGNIWKEIRNLSLVLKTAHDNGIHFGDLKVDNIGYIEEEGEFRFVLIDIDGVMQFGEEQVKQYLSKGRLIGDYTPEYMLAEDLNLLQKAAEENDDDRLDELFNVRSVYLLGLVFWHLLTVSKDKIDFKDPNGLTSKLASKLEKDYDLGLKDFICLMIENDVSKRPKLNQIYRKAFNMANKF